MSSGVVQPPTELPPASPAPAAPVAPEPFFAPPEGAGEPNYTVTPKIQVGGTTILPLTNAVYLTTGSTTGNDIFGLVDIRAAISTSAPYNPNMKVSCAVTPVNPLNTAANPVYPPSCTPTPDTVAVAANAGGSTITLSTNLTGAGSSSATPGEYQFTLTVSDPNNRLLWRFPRRREYGRLYPSPPLVMSRLLSILEARLGTGGTCTNPSGPTDCCGRCTRS